MLQAIHCAVCLNKQTALYVLARRQIVGGYFYEIVAPN